jgi:hypothetical protein
LSTDFPFNQDPSEGDEFGCISTGSLTRSNNRIFFLSKNGRVRMMEKSQPTKNITTPGIENIINRYSNITNSFGCYFPDKGTYLYQLSFLDNDNAFIFCPSSGKWCETDSLWIDYSGSESDGRSLLDDGLYRISNDYSDKYYKTIIQTHYFMPDPKDILKRHSLSSVILSITQGKGIVDEQQVCFLQVSKDNITYSNRKKKYLAPIGKRLRILRFNDFKISNNAFSIRFTLEVKQAITITKSQINFGESL